MRYGCANDGVGCRLIVITPIITTLAVGVYITAIADGDHPHHHPQSEDVLEYNHKANEQQSNDDRASCAFQLQAPQQHQRPHWLRAVSSTVDPHLICSHTQGSHNRNAPSATRVWFATTGEHMIGTNAAWSRLSGYMLTDASRSLMNDCSTTD